MSIFDEDIDHCLKVLKQGGTILYPTDTIWGIGCDATNEEAVKKVFAIKQRAAEKSLIALVADPKDVIKYVANPDPQIFDFIKSASRPTTIIYEGAIGLAPSLVQSDGTVAMRVPNERFCHHLLKRFRRPIVSTSANFSGTPAPRNFVAIANEIRTAVDYVVRYRRDDESVAEASAIVKWNRDGSKSIIRS